jgi:hypothetical protein
MKIPVDMEDLTENQVKKLLSTLIESLDDLDSNDFFGTEGWRHYLGFED